MSAETDFQALLSGYAPLTALVGSSIAQDVMPAGASVPAVVYSATHTPLLGVDLAALADQCTLTVQCWAGTGLQAAAVAAAVTAAVATAPAINYARVVDGPSTTYEAELGLDGKILTVEWWS